MSDSVFEDSGSKGKSSTSPSIHVGGNENPDVIFDDYLEDDDYSIDPLPSVRFTNRRASYDPSPTSLLTVPTAGHRRHSLSSTLTIPDTSKFHQLLDPFAEEDITEADMSNLGRRGSGVSLDYLHTPSFPHLRPPPSPGAFSTRSNWSELIRLQDRRDSQDSDHSEHSVFGSSHISSAISSKIMNLVAKFNSRTEYHKEMAIQPPTPPSEESKTTSAMSGSTAAEPKPRQHRLASYIRPVSTISDTSGHLINTEGYYIGVKQCRIKVPKFIRMFDLRRTIDPTSLLYTIWLMVVTLTYTYNAAAVPLRAAFVRAEFYFPDIVTSYETVEVCDYMYENITTTDATGLGTGSNTTTDAADLVTGSGSPELTTGSSFGDGRTTSMMNITCYTQTNRITKEKIRYYPGYETDENRIYWWICDYIADFVYLMDIILIKLRVRYVKNGLMEKDRKQCLKHYLASSNFKMDVCSLTPLDLFYLIPAVHFNSLFRLPRLLKIQTFWEFYDRLDQSVKNAHIIRVMRTLTYMLFLIHVESCIYYAVSAYEKLDFNEWTYNGQGRAYIRCMYLATKTATSIGNNPKPTNQIEYIFMIFYWLSGVFVFAMLIGQIRDIFQAANAAKTYFRDTMDKTLAYLNSMNVPKELQEKVRMWFNYNWKLQKTLNENSLLEALPNKMKTDMAIHVHYEILSKVQLFQDCDKTLLFDLVLKLKPVLYLPQDYICVKGEIGTEMYIIMSGQVEVVGGDRNDIVFATLNEGSVFGEISLLAVGGGNRRTANVRSKGYSQLFILSKLDFEAAMTEYPDAQKILKRKAKKLLNKNLDRVKDTKKEVHDEIIRSRETTPKMLRTVVQIIKPQSKIHGYLHSRRNTVAVVTEDKADTSDEDDDILVIEQIERPISEAELQKMSARQISPPVKVSARQITPPVKVSARQITPPVLINRDLSQEPEVPKHKLSVSSDPVGRISCISEDSLNAKMEEILQVTPPPKVEVPTKLPSTVINIESEAEEQESKPQKSISNKSMAAVMGDSDRLELMKKGGNPYLQKSPVPMEYLPSILSFKVQNNKIASNNIGNKGGMRKNTVKPLPNISVLDPSGLIATEKLVNKAKTRKRSKSTSSVGKLEIKLAKSNNKVGVLSDEDLKRSANVNTVGDNRSTFSKSSTVAKSKGGSMSSMDGIGIFTTSNTTSKTSTGDNGTSDNVNTTECDVLIHREKSPAETLTASPVGQVFDNDGFNDDENTSR